MEETPRSLTDAALVARVQAGDQAAFGLLVEKYRRRVERLIARLVHDPAEVEDLAQETFIKAYRAINAFRGESAFYTWLYRIALNTAKNHLVSAKREVMTTSTTQDNDEGESFDLLEGQGTDDTPERLLLSQEIARTVEEAMAELPEELRTAIQLRELEGLSYEAIAEAMGCPIGTVRSRIFRAREAIARRLRPLLETPPDRRW
ncbi:RNA polymerase sigma factor RpoE [Hydrogenophilus thiooxidans]|uniref:RNA polymerase sigma factor RpoE n=1 Tax=Hydrogenophilus thiooxidans TaxID=2820326 RepID=UPI003211A183